MLSYYNPSTIDTDVDIATRWWSDYPLRCCLEASLSHSSRAESTTVFPGLTISTRKSSAKCFISLPLWLARFRPVASRVSKRCSSTIRFASTLCASIENCSSTYQIAFCVGVRAVACATAERSLVRALRAVLSGVHAALHAKVLPPDTVTMEDT